MVVAKLGIIYNEAKKNTEVIEVQPEIDYLKIGQRIKTARLEKGLNQAELGALVGKDPTSSPGG